MADILTDLIEKRHPRSFDEYDRALREVIREIMLLALWRAKFFERRSGFSMVSTGSPKIWIFLFLEPTRVFGLRLISMQSNGSSLLSASSQQWSIARGPELSSPPSPR